MQTNTSNTIGLDVWQVDMCHVCLATLFSRWSSMTLAKVINPKSATIYGFSTYATPKIPRSEIAGLINHCGFRTLGGGRLTSHKNNSLERQVSYFLEATLPLTTSN